MISKGHLISSLLSFSSANLPYTFVGKGQWDEPKNWRNPDGSTPTAMPDLANNDVEINGIAIIDEGVVVEVNNMTINAGGSLKIGNKGKLTVKGNLIVDSQRRQTDFSNE